MERNCSLIGISTWSKRGQQMFIYEDTVGLESFLQKALYVSQHLTACHTEDSSTAAASPSTTPLAPEPMQTDRYHLSSTERARRVTQCLCLYCGSSDHLLPSCPVCPTCSAVSTVQIHPDVSSIPHIDALLMYMNQSFPVKVLVDSGASGNLISSICLTQIKLPRDPIRSPISKESRWARGWCAIAPRKSLSTSEVSTQSASRSWCWRRLQWDVLGIVSFWDAPGWLDIIPTSTGIPGMYST